jgi:hypothetical protein
MWRHDKLEDRDKYDRRRLVMVGAELIGQEGLQITSASNQQSRAFLGGGVAWSIIPESGPKSKPWFRVGTTWCQKMHFGERSSYIQTTSSHPQNWESI